MSISRTAITSQQFKENIQKYRQTCIDIIQKYRQNIDRHTHRSTDRYTDRLRLSCRNTDRHTEKHTDIHSDMLTDRHTEKQTYIQKHKRPTDIDADRFSTLYNIEDINIVKWG